MFVPGKGRVFVSADYSQQEMMCMASLADDEKMLESFDLGRDIYSHIASIAFNLPYEDCSEFYADGVTTNEEGKNRRKKAKAIALGIAYGKGVKAISEDIHVNLEKAQEIKDSILKAFPDLANYLQNVVKYGAEHGYVKDFYGRKRRLPLLKAPDYEFKFPEGTSQNTVNYYSNLYKSKLDSVWKDDDKDTIIREAKSHSIIITDNRSKKAKQTREAYNAPIQSSAAVLTKLCLLNIANNEYLQSHGAKVKLLIHDEVVLSCPEEYVYECAQELEKCAIGAGKGLKAKLRCDVAISYCWEGQKYTFDENKQLIPVKE